MSHHINILDSKIETVSDGETLTRREEIQRILEALLFSSGEPLSIEKIKEIVSAVYPIRSLEIKAILKKLNQEYRQQRRGFTIEPIAGGYHMRTVEEVSSFVQQLHQDRRGEKLSRAATETLAIVAYKQPITQAEIETIRGVDCSGVLLSLRERNLIEKVGRLEAPGHPSQYGITKRFLKHFGLKDVQDQTKVSA